MALIWFLRFSDLSNSVAKKCRIFVVTCFLLQDRGHAAFPQVAGASIARLFEILWGIFLIFRKAGENLFDFGVDLIDVFHSGVELLLIFVLVFGILGELGWRDARPTVDGRLHIVVIDDGLLHLSHFAENCLLLLAAAAAVGQVFVFFVGGSSVVALSRAQIHEVFTFDVIFQGAFLKSVDCEGLLEVVVSEGGCGSVLVDAFFCFLSVGGACEQLAVSAFFEAVDPFASWGGVILFFDFLDSLVGLAGLQFWVAVEVWEIAALAGGVGLFVGDVGEAVVFHS